jgi:hypothetical protein
MAFPRTHLLDKPGDNPDGNQPQDGLVVGPLWEESDGRYELGEDCVDEHRSELSWFHGGTLGVATDI